MVCDDGFWGTVPPCYFELPDYRPTVQSLIEEWREDAILEMYEKLDTEDLAQLAGCNLENYQ